MKRCGISCARAKRRKEINSAPAIAWRSFSSGTAGGRRRALKAWTIRHHRGWTAVRFPTPRKRRRGSTICTKSSMRRERVARLEQALDEAVHDAPAATRPVIAALQALRGIAQVSAATIVAEVGTLSRFAIRAN